MVLELGRTTIPCVDGWVGHVWREVGALTIRDSNTYQQSTWIATMSKEPHLFDPHHGDRVALLPSGGRPSVQERGYI